MGHQGDPGDPLLVDELIQEYLNGPPTGTQRPKMKLNFRPRPDNVPSGIHSSAPVPTHEKSSEKHTASKADMARLEDRMARFEDRMHAMESKQRKEKKRMTRMHAATMAGLQEMMNKIEAAKSE